MTAAIRELRVPRQHRLVHQGHTVAIIATIADVALTSQLLSSASIPLISIYNPAGTALVSDAPMTFISTGQYIYNFQTTIAMPLGLYTASVIAVNGEEVALLQKIAVFKIVKASALITFSYLLIQDQTGVLWYWYVAADNTLNSVPAVPVIPGKQPSLIVLATVPHWLQINNPTPAVRYVYPEVTGEVTVTATQPAVGAGVVGSPTFVGVSGSSFVIALNVSDEVILNLVA